MTSTAPSISTGMPDADFLRLATRVHDLPQELFDMITGLVQSPGPEPGVRVVRVTKDYKVPAVLQINHASRQASAAQYYRNSTFKFLPGYDGPCVELAKPWLDSLALEY